MKAIATWSLAAAMLGAAPHVVFAAAHSAAPAAGTAAASASDRADGEVRKVDKGARKITIKHGELKQLDMPPMTMVFQVKDPSLLDKVKQGDKVTFAAEKIGGQFTVTDIEVRQ